MINATAGWSADLSILTQPMVEDMPWRFKKLELQRESNEFVLFLKRVKKLNLR